MASVLRHVIRALIYGVIGGLVLAIVLLVVYLDRRPDLHVWHTTRLDQEFTTRSGVDDFAGYLELEERLFQQLADEIYDRIEPSKYRSIDRYSRGSLADPARWPRNWNRTFELAADSPRVGVLLLHGLSDSPYSLHDLGLRLHQEGAHVIGLRVPGHGTAPSGLVDVRWQDMAAAVRLAAAHLREVVGERPLLFVGYSNGGALAVEYCLAALEDDQLVMPEQLVLLSPEIGITRLAALAIWQSRLGHVLGLRKLAWNSILPEYDPYKYNSFALNAGVQAHAITREIQTKVARLAEGDGLARFPRTLAFQSVVDATIMAPVLVSGFFDYLPPAGHELVLFDINRFTEIEPLLARDPGAWLEAILSRADRPFEVGVVSNESEQSVEVVLRSKEVGSSETRVTGLGLRWPRSVYSLSHVALPFAPQDPVYGGPDAGPSPGIRLGNVALRGERGVLAIGGSDMLRLRWNPFFPYVEERTVEILRALQSAP